MYSIPMAFMYSSRLVTVRSDQWFVPARGTRGLVGTLIRAVGGRVKFDKRARPRYPDVEDLDFVYIYIDICDFGRK